MLPHRFLFRCSLPVDHVAGLPRKSGQLLKLPARCALPDFSELDAAPSFADVRAAWNASGLAFSVEVKGKRKPLICYESIEDSSDSVNFWIDTRNTQNIHRASRFCHHFWAIPTGAGRDRKSPTVRQRAIARAREEGTYAEPEKLSVNSEIRSDGYLLEIWLPAEVLQGFDPDTNSKLGFFFTVNDNEKGLQALSAAEGFPYSNDPSLWWTLELQGA